MTPCLTLPAHQISPQATFFFVYQDKKVLKGKCFADVEKLKQKTAEALKGIKSEEFKNFYEQWKNVSIGVLQQMQSNLEVTAV